MPGPTELIIVLVIVLVLFGANRLPSIGRGLGSGMREFKDGVTGKADDAALPKADAPAAETTTSSDETQRTAE